MVDVVNHPTLLLVASGGVLWLIARLGALLKSRYPLDEEMREDYPVLMGAALTLLGLLIGFSFSTAMTRYDQRKNLEEAEANAIGTEYLRADLLPAADAAGLKVLLKAYVEQRIIFYTVRDDDALGEVNARTSRLQTELWNAVRIPAAATPTPIVSLAVAGMNEVLNAQGYTQAAWWNRIPMAAWCLLAAIAAGCNFLVGYGLRSAATANRLLFIFPLFTAIAMTLIADIDAPRSGLILVRPQNLISLSASLSAS